MLAVDTAKLAPGAERVTQAIAKNFGNTKACLGVARALVAAEPGRRLALREHAFVECDGGPGASERFLDGSGARERVVPECPLGVGVARCRFDVRIAGFFERTRPLEQPRALVAQGLVELARPELADEAGRDLERRAYAALVFSPSEELAKGARREARVRVAPDGRNEQRVAPSRVAFSNEPGPVETRPRGPFALASTQAFVDRERFGRLFGAFVARRGAVKRFLAIDR